jgi:hypothetical protein
MSAASMTPVSPPSLPAAGSSWVDRYECLRARALEIGARRLDDAQGLVLFLRQGMSSWMSEVVAEASAPSVRPSPQQHCLPVRDDRAEITRMLASMVGSALEEVHA